MKTIILAAVAVLSVASVASAATPATQTGHWEWVTSPSFGPRSPLATNRRVWVSGDQQSACNCAMMDQAAEACMSMRMSKHG